jgi:D-galactarolactone cycloisomerase
MGRELERLGFYWWEEPLPQSTPEYAGYEILTQKLDIPIAACEGLTSRGMFKEAISRRAMDIVQPDAALCGGVGECLFVAEMAKLWGITCMPHCWGSALSLTACVHLVSLVPDASWSRHTEPPMVEMDVSENPLRDEILKEPLQIKDGFVTVPAGPGLGIEVDEAKLMRYLKR